MRSLSFAALVAAVVSCGLLPVDALGQFRSSYPGDYRTRAPAGGAHGAAPLPATFAWYGDSITQGACNGTPPPAKLTQLLTGYSGVNRGVSGENVSEITTRYFANNATDCLGEPCGTYILAGGTNDCGNGGCDTDAVLATMLAAVDHALAAGRRVVWFNIPPFRKCDGCVGGTYSGVLKSLEYRTKWQEACSVRSNVTCLDAFLEMEAPWEDEAERGYLVDAYACSPTDRVHTSQAGADYLAAMARRAFP